MKEIIAPDGGYGWMVIAGAFLIMVVNQMLGPSFGIMFSGLLNSLNVSSVTVAWIFNVQAVMWNISQLFAPPLCDVFGWRKVALVGAVLAALSISVSAFASSALFLFFSFSFLSGFGGGLDTAVCFFIVPSYFKKRRGISMALMLSGVCLGQFVGPLLISYLQKMYGFLGATLILGSVFLHSVVGASLFHPVAWHSKKIPESKMSDQTMARRPTVDESAEEETTPLEEIPKPTEKGPSNSNSSKSTPKSPTLRNIFPKVWKATKSNLKMVKSCRAIAIGLGTSLTFNGYFNFNMQVPFVLQYYGYSLQESAWCISAAAICNMVSRLFILISSDWKKFNKIVWHLAGTLLLVAGSFAFIFVFDYSSILICMCLTGFGIGVNMGLYSLVIIDVMGMTDYPATFGITSLFIGIGSITIGPFAGFLRDSTGSFVGSLLFLAGTMMLGFVTLLCTPIAIKVDKRRTLVDK